MPLSVDHSTKTGRDFLDLDRIHPADLKSILAHAHKLKKQPLAFRPLTGKTLALIFEKPSTRTRVSFEVGMRQLGGQVTTLTSTEIQLGHGETVGDTGRVLSRYVDIIMIRTFVEHKLYELAAGATVPVINGLTNESHPCQIMADLMTIEERFGTLKGKTIVWAGDGANNVLTSWIHAAPVFDFTLKVIAPPEFTVPKTTLDAARERGARLTVTPDVKAATGADVVLTDCWVSMHNSDSAARQEKLAPYQVNVDFMQMGSPQAIFMHCLPAHRGEEVTDGVLDSAQSAVWDEAENRLHAQKAILCWCLGISNGASCE
jgi:ornithine carbamoyltransferase